MREFGYFKLLKMWLFSHTHLEQLDRQSSEKLIHERDFPRNETRCSADPVVQIPSQTLVTPFIMSAFEAPSSGWVLRSRAETKLNRYPKEVEKGGPLEGCWENVVEQPREGPRGSFLVHKTSGAPHTLPWLISTVLCALPLPKSSSISVFLSIAQPCSF